VPKRSRGWSCSQHDSCRLSSPSSARDESEVAQHTLQSSASYVGVGVSAEPLKDEDEDDEDEFVVTLVVVVVVDPSVADPASSVVVVVVVVVVDEPEDDADPCASATGALPTAIASATASAAATVLSRGFRVRIRAVPLALALAASRRCCRGSWTAPRPLGAWNHRRSERLPVLRRLLGTSSVRPSVEQGRESVGGEPVDGTHLAFVWSCLAVALKQSVP
jgi:hypothetical protein